MYQRTPYFILATAICLGSVASLEAAGQDVTGITTQTTTGNTSVVDGLTYDNITQGITGFSDAQGTTYQSVSTAQHTAVQRNGTPNQSSAWYAINAATGDLAAVNQTDYGVMLKSNNLLSGADNVFANGTGASSGNIERLDYTWSTATSSSSQRAFAVFERGTAGAHDGFTIAVITAIDPSTGAPAAYGGFLKIATGWGGNANLAGDPTNQLLRYSAGDALTSLTNRSNLASDQNVQGVGGIVIKVSEFNLPAGTSVYGYSLMGGDVNPNNPSDLLNVTSTTVYPADTTDGGGIDLASLNGISFAFATVPEPATWVTLGMGVGLAALVYMRRRPVA